MSRWLVVLVVASGCDYVLGLTHLGPRSATEDKGHVVGTYHQRWIENDQFGSVMTGMRGAPLALTATVVLDDGSTRDVTWLDSENFAFTVEEPGDHYAFDVHTPFSDASFQLTSADPFLVERFPGRIDRDPVVPGTSVALTVNSRPVTAMPIKDELHSTGVWSRSAIDVNADNKTFSLDWTTVVTAGVMGVLAKPDELWYAHYVNTGPYVRLDAYAEIKDAMLAQAMTTPYTVNALVAGTQLCTHLKTAYDAEGQRIASAAGAATAYGFYLVSASPIGGEYRDTVEFPLAYAAPPPTAPIDVMVTYASPYHTVEQTAQVTVYAVVGGATLGSTVIVTAPTSCNIAGQPVILTVPLGAVAVPTSATIGGVPLDSDGRALSVAPDDTLDVTWAATSGAVDYWVVEVQQLLGTAAVTKLVITTLEPHAKLPANTLVAGKTYRLYVGARLGFAGAQQGHFDAFDPQSFATGALVSPTFVP